MENTTISIQNSTKSIGQLSQFLSAFLSLKQLPKYSKHLVNSYWHSYEKSSKLTFYGRTDVLLLSIKLRSPTPPAARFARPRHSLSAKKFGAIEKIWKKIRKKVEKILKISKKFFL